MRTAIVPEKRERCAVFVEHPVVLLRAAQLWCVLVFQSFISHSRSVSDSSGLICCDPECPGFPQRDAESPQNCQASGMLFCSRHTALTSANCVTPCDPQRIRNMKKKLQSVVEVYCSFHQFIHRGFNQIYKVKGITKLTALSCSGRSTYCGLVS